MNVDPERSKTLVSLIHVGSISSRSNAEAIILSVPANGQRSSRTGEAFTCRIWVKDVLVALQAHGIVVLPTDIGKSATSVLVPRPYSLISIRFLGDDSGGVRPRVGTESRAGTGRDCR